MPIDTEAYSPAAVAAALVAVALGTAAYMFYCQRQRQLLAPPPALTYLGHAGFIYAAAGKRILIDPWFSPAFSASWFPFPDNRFLLQGAVFGGAFDVLYISHTHEDHLDRALLRKLPGKKTLLVLCAAFTSGHLEAELRAIGFRNIRTLKHKESIDLVPEHPGRLVATMFLDASFKEDSGLLLECYRGPTHAGTKKTHRFLNLNDCNTRMDELPRHIDVLAAQFSGAQWYPDVYEQYSGKSYESRVCAIREGLENLLLEKLIATGARTFLPSAGVHVFLDSRPRGNTISRFNCTTAGGGRGASSSSIFPQWEQFADQMNFAKRCRAALGRDVAVLRCFPGDRVALSANGRLKMTNDRRDRPASALFSVLTAERLKDYQEQRQSEIDAWWATPFRPVSTVDLRDYFNRWHAKNSRVIRETKWSKFLRIGVFDEDGGIRCSWGCKIGFFGRGCADALPVVIALDGEPDNVEEEGAVPGAVRQSLEKLFASGGEQYSFDLPERMLRRVCDERLSWEDAFASMRVKMSRSPDIYDTGFMVTLRYGANPAVPEKFMRQRADQSVQEMIELPELPGVRISRWCPHQGADLKNATVVNGVITCPRHFWKFCADTGKCISGGDTGIAVEKIEW